MTATRKKTKEKVDEVSVPKVNGKVDPANDPKKTTGVGGSPAPAAPAKRPLGTKEVIPFQWKLISESHGMVLTLFKSVELPEVEAQLERIRREGYYRNLRILEADTKIVQPKAYQLAKKREEAAKKAAEQKAEREAKKAAKKAAEQKAEREAKKAAKKTASRVKKAPKRPPKPAPPKRTTKRATTAKKSTKKTAKKATKKTASAKSPKKSAKKAKARKKK